MPILPNFHQFNGYYWETASIANALDYAGVIAPHTQKPYTEALLMGVSGGAVVGYFSFAYVGHDPYVALLTRNTFDPMETIYNRLAIPREIYQTTNATTAMKQVVQALEQGDAPLVWADAFSLPYTTLPKMDDMWAMMPLVVYGIEGDTVYISDRANVGLTITVNDFAQARARVKATKHRSIVLGIPDESQLVLAVQKGIFDCLKIYLEEPPKGSKQNFGLTGLQRWADLLVKPKEKNSWAKVFSYGGALYAGLCTAFEGIETFGKNGKAERDVYAEFLDECAVLLNKPALHTVAHQFRQAGDLWTALANALLPNDVPLLKETRELLLQKRDMFLQYGNAMYAQRLALQARLDDIKAQIQTAFPISESETHGMLQHIREHVLQVLEAERDAVNGLQHAMAFK